MVIGVVFLCVVTVALCICLLLHSSKQIPRTVLDINVKHEYWLAAVVKLNGGEMRVASNDPTMQFKNH